MNKIYKILNNSSNKYSNFNVIKCEEILYTYKCFNDTVIEIANDLKNIGIKKYSKVILCLKYPVEFVKYFFAVKCCDAIVMPVYFDIGNNNLNKIARAYNVDYIITDDISNVNSNLKQFRFCNNIYINENIKEGLDDIYELSDVEIILFSSGTTNVPKAIMLTDLNIFFNITSISKYLNLDNSDKLLIIKNLNHVSSIIGELLVGIYNGCEIVLSNKLKTPKKILELLEQNYITTFFAVPTILKYLMNYKNLDKFDLSKLKIVHFYGGPMKGNDIIKLINLFPSVNFIYSYGQTEASPRITYIETNDLLKKNFSSGKPLDGIKIIIYDENNIKLDALQVGEIAIKGPNIMKGYYKNKNLTENTIINNTLFTGDLGYIDNDGFLYVMGRKDNMIISQGKNIYVEEIEQIILEFENILEALVIPKITENETYTLTAYIVTKNNIDINALFEHCKSNLEYYKVPNNIKIVDSLEKTYSEKVKRNQTFL